ncbi:hypothetical protein [Limnobacter parvus]|uniref:NAD(+)--protein-arginine ADP-ribosyltransferase n=1 Tax=Limnobacter parvus TaxID=2939690 RepID=A0ABT1XKS7_9BURK|nr:hypothetical protein [Limnobacter parvus]MCR2747123.1 hypothetical protein [Limnobacter parvus]
MRFNSLSRATGNLAKHVRGISQESARIADCDVIKLLGKHCNLNYLREIVGNGRSAIQPRTAQTSVSEAGLLAIAAYTSAGLDRMIHETYSSTGGPSHHRGAMLALESLILRTLHTMALTRVGAVKRNLTLNPEEFRSIYKPGALVRFDRITSVTLQPHQVYRGGNVDLTIGSDIDVIDVSSLSAFSGQHARGEKEGLLEPGSIFEVLRMEPRKEHSPLDLPQPGAPLHCEEWSVVLRQSELTFDPKSPLANP